jgi:hypothetical protein
MNPVHTFLPYFHKIHSNTLKENCILQWIVKDTHRNTLDIWRSGENFYSADYKYIKFFFSFRMWVALEGKWCVCVCVILFLWVL